jgi:GAF domain-containing protein
MNEENSNSAPVGRLEELAAYAELSKISFADQPLPETLQKVATLAKLVLSESPEVSVTLVKGDRAQTAAFTDQVAAYLDERQYDRGFGPCMDAAASGQTIKLVTGDAESLYGDFCRLAQGHGVTHTMSMAMPATAETAGALNFYGSSGRPFSAEDERIAGTFATFAGIVVGNFGLDHDPAELALLLKTAVESRAVIEQAKGIMMSQRHCSAEEAFLLLTRQSQNQDITVRVLAQALVDRTIRP